MHFAAADLATRLRVIVAQLADHIHQVFIVDPANPPELRQRALGQQIQIVDQPRHRRIIAIRILGLQRQTFCQIPCTDTHRIQRLHDTQYALDVDQSDIHALGQFQQVCLQIAAFVDLIDDMLRHEQI